MNKLIDSIVDLEWENFQQVHGTNGRASCQDNHKVFSQMRKSQFAAWSEDLCALYLEDLRLAQSTGRNLLAEKYARMMEYTAPQEYSRLKDALPVITEETAGLVDIIVAFHTAWQQQSAAVYPKLAARSRPQQELQGKLGETSFATYLRGELLTYSPTLLRAYAAYVREMYSKGVNLHNIILENTVKLSGYQSLAQAESKL